MRWNEMTKVLRDVLIHVGIKLNFHFALHWRPFHGSRLCLYICVYIGREMQTFSRFPFPLHQPVAAPTFCWPPISQKSIHEYPHRMAVATTQKRGKMQIFPELGIEDWKDREWKKWKSFFIQTLFLLSLSLVEKI